MTVIDKAKRCIVFHARWLYFCIYVRRLSYLPAIYVFEPISRETLMIAGLKVQIFEMMDTIGDSKTCLQLEDYLEDFGCCFPDGQCDLDGQLRW